MSEKPEGWGSTQEFQSRMKAFADQAFGGDYSIATVFKKVKIELEEVRTAIALEKSADVIGLEIADVVLAILLLGDLHGRDIGVLMRLKLDQIADRKWKKLEDGTWQHVEADDAEEVSAKEGLDQVQAEKSGPSDVRLFTLSGED